MYCVLVHKFIHLQKVFNNSYFLIKNLMKKSFFIALMAGVAVFFSACGVSFGGYDASTDGIERIFSDVTRTVTEEGMIDEFSIGFSKDEGQRSMIDYFQIDFQSKSDTKKLQRVSYHSYNGWSAIEPLEITVHGGDASSYNLNDDVAPFSTIDPAVVKKIYDSALQTLGETCDDIVFVSLSAKLDAGRDIKYSTYLSGVLKSNGVKDKFFSDYDKNGNLLKR